MVGFLSRLFAKPDPAPFAIAVGRQDIGDQITVDAQRMFIGNDLYYAPLPPWAAPHMYRQLYHTNELATGSANIIERFVVTRIKPVNVEPDVARRLSEIFDRIDLQGALRMLCRNGQIYGYGILEAVYADDFSDIIRLVCPNAYNVRVKPDVYGNVLSYLQLPGFAPWTTQTNKYGQIEIPGDKCIPFVRDPTSTFDWYGSSLYQSALNRFIQLETLITCQLNSAKRVGQPRFFIGVDNEGLTPEQYAARIADVQTAFAALGKSDAADVYMPPSCTVSIIGADAQGRYREEIIQCTASIISSMSIPSQLLTGVSISTGASENMVRQVTISFMTLVQSQQQSLAKSVNTHLMPMLSRIYGLPDNCAIEFERSRVIDTLLEAQADAAEFQNQWNLVQKGIQKPGWLAEQCGVDELANPELFRQSLAMPQPTSNMPDAVKADSTTKISDTRATGNTSY